jgi:hypothetical protein
LQLLVIAAEQFLRVLEHAREVLLGKSQQRHDDVQREVHRDLLHEVALAAGVDHLVDERAGQLVDANLQRAHRLRPEPVRTDRAHHAVLRVVHVNQRADAHGCLLRIGLRRHQHRSG